MTSRKKISHKMTRRCDEALYAENIFGFFLAHHHHFGGSPLTVPTKDQVHCPLTCDYSGNDARSSTSESWIFDERRTPMNKNQFFLFWIRFGHSENSGVSHATNDTKLERLAPHWKSLSPFFNYLSVNNFQRRVSRSLWSSSRPPVDVIVGRSFY